MWKQLSWLSAKRGFFRPNQCVLFIFKPLPDEEKKTEKNTNATRGPEEGKEIFEAFLRKKKLMVGKS
jgi:hypothetical protein